MEFKTVGIVGKFGKQDIGPTLEEVKNILEDLSVTVMVDERTSDKYPRRGFSTHSTAELGGECDLIVVVGGDGTFLHVARDMAKWNKSMLGVNLGRVGFLTDITPDTNMSANIKSILYGEYIAETRSLLESKITRGDEVINRCLSLNDIVVHKWEVARMIEFETRIDGHFVNIQRSDGIIVSTPTGSTAYALSSGGPIMEPDINAVTLVPICPHTLSNRPIVISDNSKIEIELIGSPTTKAQLTSDGHTTANLCVDDVAHIKCHANHIRLIHPKGYEPYKAWREKLHWSSTPH